MIKEFLIADFTGKLKVWTTSSGMRHVFKDPVPVERGVGYVLLSSEANGMGKVLRVYPPPYRKGLYL